MMRRLVAKRLPMLSQLTRPSPLMALRVPTFSFSERKEYEFKAETKKLLDIVAKSLYTDADVFIRELLSNASDALEKQRYMQYSGQDTMHSSDPLQISVLCDEEKKTITIQDVGIGMSQQDLLDNLGTIASSGSRKFMDQISNESRASGELGENIIGQFGVGFYSVFIVGNNVEVTTRQNGQQAYLWTSDGSGKFDVQPIDTDFQRGTKIVIHLRNDHAKFSKVDTVKAIIEKHSGFLNYDVFLNGQKTSSVGALWTKDKREISEEQYQEFYEHITGGKVNYKFKLHYSADVPLMVKALFYIPPTHSEKYGMQEEKMQVGLYCKKVLIKPDCRELLPRWLRFVKGVVDCEDLPLNISRENYQDSALLAKLKSLLTRRVLKLLQEQADNNLAAYLDWYRDFQFFLKEGLATEPEYQDQILKLCRYQTNYSGLDLVSLDDYVAKLKPDQEKIYFLLAPSREAALQSPYYEPFKNSQVPVIFINLHVDEMVFQGVPTFKGKYKFVNIETSFEEIAKELEPEQKEETKQEQESIHEDDLPAFSLWLKKELEPTVNKVQVSKRLSDSPALIQGQMSSGMRQIMQMLEQENKDKGQAPPNLNTNLTLEINAKHPLLVQLNQTRKTNIGLAAILAKQILDNTLMAADLLTDKKNYINRVNRLMLSLMDSPQQIQDQVAPLPMDELERDPEMQSILEELEDSTEEEEKNFQEEIVIDEKGNPKVQ